MAKKTTPTINKVVEPTVSVSDLQRSEVRYAIFRCRSGNPEPKHLDIYKYYEDRLKDHDLSFTSFTVKWDISLTDNTVIVSGLDLTPLIQKVEGSLFDKDGNLKDFD